MYTKYIGIDRAETGERPFLLCFPFLSHIMKKNIKKQSNKKIKKVSGKKSPLLIVAKKKTPKKALKKVISKNKKTKKIKVATKPAVKKNQKVVLRQKTKKTIKRKRKQANKSPITFGDFNFVGGKILLLVLAIIFVSSILLFQYMTKAEEQIEVQPKVAGVENVRNFVREKEINDLVQGYPIEKMTRYIAKQDPKVSAFLIAIAKKESAWGERKPILNGEDCYNYWGFRLKSDRMGSGGHTCFDSPQEAVEIVGARLNHLVNEEKIDTPKEMVIWKCGYACNGPESAGSEKWIKDVDYYYRQLIN